MRLNKELVISVVLLKILTLGENSRWSVKPVVRYNIVVSDIFLIPEDAPKPQGYPDALGVTMFTQYTLPHADVTPTLTYIRHTNRLYATTNTELCQMNLGMQVEAKAEDQDIAVIPSNHTFQEVYCNSLGMALTAAENGVTYTDYLSLIKGGTGPVFVYEGKSYPALPFSETLYEQMQQLTPLYY